MIMLLGNLYKRNRQLPMSAPISLPGGEAEQKALSLESLCKDLATRDSFPIPNTFARALILVAWTAKLGEVQRPWNRLPPGLKGSIHLRVLTFISCVGMMMNGYFVDYNHLRDLLQEISPIMSQAQLQKLQTLGKFTLSKVYIVLIWKLHESIPFHVQQQTVRHQANDQISSNVQAITYIYNRRVV